MRTFDISEKEYDEKNVESQVAAFEYLVVLAPLVSHCYDCVHRLTWNHVTTVKCYTCTGARQSAKVTLICKGCSISYPVWR